MAQKWRPNTEAILRDWIKECKACHLDMTDWENDFIDSVDKALDLFGSLTRKQEEILEKIYSEKTS